MPLHPGVLSTAGWYVIDDTDTALLSGGGTGFQPRPPHAGPYQDWYLLAYGHDYARWARGPARPHRPGAALAAQRFRRVVLALLPLLGVRLPRAARPVSRQPRAAGHAVDRHRLEAREQPGRGRARRRSWPARPGCPTAGTGGSGTRACFPTRSSSSTGRTAGPVADAQHPSHDRHERPALSRRRGAGRAAHPDTGECEILRGRPARRRA